VQTQARAQAHITKIMQAHFSRDRYTWLAYLMLALYGYFINIIGPITPFLKDELSLSYTVGSLHYTLFAVGILLVGLGGNQVIARFGRWKALWLGAAGLSAGALLLILGKTPLLTISAAFLMGLVGSLILTIVPLALSDQHGPLRAVALSEANVIASLVSSAAPLLVGFFARTAGRWWLALGVGALVPLLLFPLFRTANAESRGHIPRQVGRSSKTLPVLYWVYWACLALAVAAEFCMVSWSGDYFQTILGIPQAEAAQAISLFLGAMILGRLAASALVKRISIQQLVPASTLLAIAGFLVYWMANSAVMGMTGLFLTGLGIASLYPLLLSMAMGAAGAQTVQASTRATLASGTAILVLPLVLGRLADAFGIHSAYGIVLALLVGILTVVLAAPRFGDAQS